MKIKLIDFGLKKDHHPFRPHENDAGADVFMPYDCTLKPGEIARIPLGFGLIIPDGYAGYVFPRSSMAVKGLVCELPPIDSDIGVKSCDHQQCKYIYPDYSKRHTRRSASDHTCGNCGFRIRAWHRTWDRCIWKHRAIKYQIFLIILK